MLRVEKREIILICDKMIIVYRPLYILKTETLKLTQELLAVCSFASC